MTDLMDWVNEQNELHLKIALKNRPKVQGLYSAVECEVCGNEIPEERRKAIPGVSLCIECKRAEELKSQRFSK